MSIQIISEIAAAHIYSAGIYAYFNRTCDENYSYTISSLKGDIEAEMEGMIKILLNLNEESYCIKYEAKNQNLADFYNIKQVLPVSVFQTLKYCQCLRYNIEVSIINNIRALTKIEEKAVKTLEHWIDDLKSGIISQLPEYQKAAWS